MTEFNVVPDARALAEAIAAQKCGQSRCAEGVTCQCRIEAFRRAAKGETMPPIHTKLPESGQGPYQIKRVKVAGAYVFKMYVGDTLVMARKTSSPFPPREMMQRQARGNNRALLDGLPAMVTQ